MKDGQELTALVWEKRKPLTDNKESIQVHYRWPSINEEQRKRREEKEALTVQGYQTQRDTVETHIHLRIHHSRDKVRHKQHTSRVFCILYSPVNERACEKGEIVRETVRNGNALLAVTLSLVP